VHDELVKLLQEAKQNLSAAADERALEELRVKYLGRKGLLSAIMKKVASAPPEERPVLGRLANQVKQELTGLFDQAFNTVRAVAATRLEALDVTLPGRKPPRGHLHPLTQVKLEICDIFERMGFEVVEGPDIELDYYNFEALNIPKDHPARDMQDTFYISDNVVLRTHTSPLQVRVMEKQPPPVRIIAPGAAYRCDSDVTHTPMFHQVEGLLVDRGVTFGDLKGILTAFVHQMFGSDTDLRFRPSFFPFTEPSAEVDIRCVRCKGAGCRVCSNTGWLEILGSGMVDPAVYGFVGYDPEEISGFAFGMGIERVTMLKYGIDDIRLFFENDVRFLSQF
jgi:phenylalanyl-tRNA synthetase alpha chain